MNNQQRNWEIEAVKELGERIGYGNMMGIASELWKEHMLSLGYPTSGVFVPVMPGDIKTEHLAEYIK